MHSPTRPYCTSRARLRAIIRCHGYSHGLLAIPAVMSYKPLSARETKPPQDADGNYPCAHKCGRVFGHAPAAVAHSKACKMNPEGCQSRRAKLTAPATTRRASGRGKPKPERFDPSVASPATQTTTPTPASKRYSQGLFPFSIGQFRQKKNKGRTKLKSSTILIPTLSLKANGRASRELKLTRGLLARWALTYDDNLAKNGAIAKTAWGNLFHRGYVLAVTHEIVQRKRSGSRQKNVMYRQATSEEIRKVEEAGVLAFEVIDTMIHELKDEVDSHPSPGRLLAILRAFRVLGTLCEVVGPDVPFTGQALDLWKRSVYCALGDCPAPGSQERYIRASEITRRNVDELIRWCEDNWSEVVAAARNNFKAPDLRGTTIYTGDRNEHVKRERPSCAEVERRAEIEHARPKRVALWGEVRGGQRLDEAALAALKETYAREQATI